MSLEKEMETLTVERHEEMNRGWVLGLFVSMEEVVVVVVE